MVCSGALAKSLLKMLEGVETASVSKEGFDDEDKLLRTVFVGNLPLKVKKKTLLKEFKKFGEVESVRIRSVPIQDVGFPFSRVCFLLLKFQFFFGDDNFVFACFS